MAESLFESNLVSLKLIARGKVRDIYSVDAERLLIVATDRLSAFDVVLPDPIPGKGVILTSISNFWFKKLESVVPNHLTGIEPEAVLSDRARSRDGQESRRRRPQAEAAAGRSRRARLSDRLGLEGLLQDGPHLGRRVAAGARARAAPARADLHAEHARRRPGQHDENISMEQVKKLIGADLTRQVRDASLQLYTRATEYARERGIIIADTKFEFGLDATGALRVMDEVLTPDSSRFWPADTYKAGSSPPSFDKQYIRDYLETLDWNKQAAGAEAAGRRHRAHAREVCGSATAADERTAGMTAARSHRVSR